MFSGYYSLNQKRGGSGFEVIISLIWGRGLRVSASTAALQSSLGSSPSTFYSPCLWGDCCPAHVASPGQFFWCCQELG